MLHTLTHTRITAFVTTTTDVAAAAADTATAAAARGCCHRSLEAGPVSHVSGKMTYYNVVSKLICCNPIIKI